MPTNLLAVNDIYVKLPDSQTVKLHQVGKSDIEVNTDEFLFAARAMQTTSAGGLSLQLGEGKNSWSMRKQLTDHGATIELSQAGGTAITLYAHELITILDFVANFRWQGEEL